MKKRYLTTILAIAMISSAMAGCTSSDPGSAEGTTSSTPESSNAEQSSQEESQEPEPSGADKSIPIKILRSYASNMDFETDPSVAIMEDYTGFDIDFDTLPEKGPIDQLHMIFSSGSVDYDYIYLSPSNEAKAAFATYADRGLLADITELKENYEYLNALDSTCFEMTTINDRVYGIASTGLPNPFDNGFLRADWLEAIGKDMPTTLDELYEVLKMFKEQDPGGNGIDNIAFTASNYFVPAITQAFGFIEIYEDRDGQIVDVRTLPEYEEYLTFMNKLYAEGILDPDLPINTGGIVQEKVVSGKVGYYSGWVDPAVNFLIASNESGTDGVEFKPMAAIPDQNGVQRSTTQKGLHALSMIPADSENIEGVLEFINEYLEPENFDKIVNGNEGEDYTVVDGDRYPTDTFNDRRGKMYNVMPVQDGDAYLPLWLTRTRKTAEWLSVYEDVIAVNDDFQSVYVMDFAPAIESVSAEVQAVDSYAYEESIKFITGARDLSEFDSFVSELEEKGSIQIAEAYNEWYSK